MLKTASYLTLPKETVFPDFFIVSFISAVVVYSAACAIALVA